MMILPVSLYARHLPENAENGVAELDTRTH